MLKLECYFNVCGEEYLDHTEEVQDGFTVIV